MKLHGVSDYPRSLGMAPSLWPKMWQQTQRAISADEVSRLFFAPSRLCVRPIAANAVREHSLPLWRFVLIWTEYGIQPGHTRKVPCDKMPEPHAVGEAAEPEHGRNSGGKSRVRGNARRDCSFDEKRVPEKRRYEMVISSMG